MRHVEIPFIDNLRVDQSKIVGYLLSEATGRGKAAFFSRLGFRPDAWEILADAFKAQARDNPVTSAVDSAYGRRYSVDGEINAPDDRWPRARVCTVWILEPGSQAPRLITAHPA